MDIRVKKTTKTTNHHQLDIDNQLLIKLLQAQGEDVPDNAVVSVRVPGGGDWSNEDLFIGSDATIEVNWSTTE